MFFFFFDKNNIVDEVKNIFYRFGLDAEVETVNQPKGLPLYMVSNRSFLSVNVCGESFIVVAVRDGEDYSIDALVNQIEKYKLALSRPVAFLFERISFFQQKALFSKRIPFVSRPSMIYLPFLGMAMQRRKNVGGEKKTEKMTPQVQVVFLYLLYKVKDSYVSKTRLSFDVGQNSMSVYRACKSLESWGLIKQEEYGRTVQITCALLGRELVNAAIPYLINPVKKSIVVMKEPYLEKCPKAGETALSMMSMLGAPNMEVMACLKENVPRQVVDS